MTKELAQDISLRCARLQQAMQRKNIDACVLSTPVNVFYVAGMVYNGYCYLPAQGEAIHFVKRPSVELYNTVSVYKPELIRDELEKRNLTIPASILLEVDVLSMNECMRLMRIFGIQEANNASSLLRELRSVKTDFEVSQIRACARKHEAVYEQIGSIYRTGMTDVELQVEIERLMRLNGSIGIFRTYGSNMDIFMGSLLVGDNAQVPSPFDFALGGAGIHCMLPLGSAGKKIEQGQTIMVDMAGNYSSWMTDMTRVFSAGKTTELAYKAHRVSQDIQEQIMQTAKPGVGCAQLWDIALALVKKNSLEPYFMGTDLQAKFVGHGVGLEINEPPVLTARSREILEPNVVFALEPKFVIPQVGAVGIENTFVVTDTGLEKITQFEENIIEL